MAEDAKKKNGFPAAQPQIPGVTGGVAQKPESGEQKSEDAEENSARSAADILRTPYVWAGGGGAILALVIALVWWAHGAARVPLAPEKTSAVAPEAAPVRSSAETSFGPGVVATVSEMKEPWSTKEFVYRKSNGETQPALLVHLPGDAYWAVSLREPYESCQLEMVSAEKLRSDYNVDASYPMIGDPCTHAVFDLTQYENGPNGLVRGAIVSGAAVRPPLAIEVEVKGDKIIASREENIGPGQ